MSKKNIETVTFNGVDFEVNTAAINSFKIQKAIACAQTHPEHAFDAMDTICCGKSDEYMERMPDVEGEEVAEFGCSGETFGAFIAAAMERFAAKN